MSIRLPLVMLSAIATGAVAQCPGVWDSSHAVAGVNGDVLASIRWDPDADGPLPSLLIVAGDFNAACTSPVANIAAWDPDSGQWSPVGSNCETRSHSCGSERFRICHESRHGQSY